MNGTDIGIDYLSGLEVLGRGGFSVVYAATDTRFDRRVAVKVLRPFSSESERKMFQRECRAMGRLSSHKNVVTLYEAGFAADDSPFILMELVEGGSLDDLLEQRGQIPWAEAVDYVAQAAEAIEHAHGADVLHRDVKPANILVAADGVKLTDFGISGVGVSGDTSSVNVAASWMHSPPETFPNKRDTRSDIYALGSTLYTLIVGTAPLWQDDSDGIETIMYRVLHEVPPPVPTHLAPANLCHLIARTLAKAPEERPQTATDFLAELHSSTSGGISDTATVAPPLAQPGEVPALHGVGQHGIGQPGVGQPATGLPPVEPPRSSKSSAPVFMASLLAVALGGGALAMNMFRGSDTTTPDVEEVMESTSEIEDVADPTTTITTTSSTPSASTDATPATLPVTSSTSTTPTTVSSTTTAIETTQAAPVPSLPLFEDNIGQAPGEVDALIAFLDQHPQEVVELDLELTLGDDDFFRADESGGPTVVFGDSGYSIRFFEENDGTSGVFFVRGSNYRVSGYFSVGELFGPNQGILTQALDPVAPEVALASGG